MSDPRSAGEGDEPSRLLLDSVVERGEIACRQGLVGMASAFAQLAAEFAARGHPALLRHTRLERLLWNLGRHLPVPTDVPEARQPGAILHVVTDTARPDERLMLLDRLIRTDTTHRHVIALTHATEAGVLRDPVEKTDSGLIVLSEPFDTLPRRAARLRLFAAPYDLVVLHTEPFDVVPSLALATTPRPLVITVDDGLDHFRLEPGFADAIVVFRANVAVFAERVRSMSADRIVRLPRPLPVPTCRRSADAARHALGVERDGLVVLVLGIAGVAERETLLRTLADQFPTSTVLADDSPGDTIWDATDVVIDASGRAASPLILEAAARGLCTIVHRSSNGTAAAAFDDCPGLREVALVSTSVEGLVAHLHAASNREERTRRGAMLQAEVRIRHAGANWRTAWGTAIASLEPLGADGPLDGAQTEVFASGSSTRECADDLIRCCEHQLGLLGYQFSMDRTSDAGSPMAPYVAWAIELATRRLATAADAHAGHILRLTAELEAAAIQIERTDARLADAIERERALRVGVDDIFASGSYKLAMRISALTKRFGIG